MKIKHKIITKMITKKLTRAEVDFLLHIIQYQDNNGNISGVYYKEIKQALNISCQKFYDLKKSLIEKGFIVAVKGSYSDWNIQITDNEFYYDDCSNPVPFVLDEEEKIIKRNEPYLNLNLKVFKNDEFKSMKAREKLLFLDFLRMQVASKGQYSIKIRVEEFYKKYKALFGVQKRVLQNYLTTLKKFFSIGIKNGMYYITALKETLRKDSRVESRVRDEFAFNTLCRRNKIKRDKQAKETFALIKQYAKRGCNFTKLNIAIIRSWKLLNKGIDTKKWNLELRPEFIHKILLDILQIF